MPVTLGFACCLDVPVAPSSPAGRLLPPTKATLVPAVPAATSCQGTLFLGKLLYSNSILATARCIYAPEAWVHVYLADDAGQHHRLCLLNSCLEPGVSQMLPTDSSSLILTMNRTWSPRTPHIIEECTRAWGVHQPKGFRQGCLEDKSSASSKPEPGLPDA